MKEARHFRLCVTLSLNLHPVLACQTPSQIVTLNMAVNSKSVCSVAIFLIDWTNVLFNKTFFLVHYFERTARQYLGIAATRVTHTCQTYNLLKAYRWGRVTRC